MLITIQPQDDAFCTVKTKRKFIRKRDATLYWYECSKCGYTLALGKENAWRMIASDGE